MATDPVLIAYTATRNKTGKRVHWTRIGEAYPHETGAGLTVVLHSFPLDGRVYLLELDSTDDTRLAAQAELLRKAQKTKPRDGTRNTKPRGN